jgi:hypothetical protein
MKMYRTLRIRGAATVLGGFAMVVGAAQAAPFAYSPGDLLLAFRQAGGASDYVVNIGKSGDFSTLPAGTTLTISNLSVTQLGSSFPTLNGLQWSVAAANRPPLVAGFPLQTIWVVAPRLDPSAQSSSWLRKGQYVQGTAASQIDAIGVNSANASSSQVAGPNNTTTGVVIPTASDFALTAVIGDSGNYAGTFQGNVEGVTADDFDSNPSNVSRADLYELVPGSSLEGTLNTPGRYLGYFELKPDGSLTFNTGLPLPPAPSISEITYSNNVAKVSFTTVAGGSYFLRAANTLNAPVSTWAVVNGPVSGTGSVLSLLDTNATNSRFFAVEAQP